jgi:hypothetical protein
MPTPPTTTGRLIDSASDLTRMIDDLREHNVIDLALYRSLSPRVRHIARLACRVDAQRRAGIGLLSTGRIARDVAAALYDTADDDGPVAA